MRSVLKQIAEPIEKRLATFLEEVSRSPIKGMFNTHAESRLLAQVRDLTLRGGKRIRGALVTKGASLFDPNALARPQIIDGAASLELFHSYLLIHDDIMDNDDLRRGGKSVHTALAKETGSRDLGVGLGVLAGDLAAALSQMLFASLNVELERHQKASSIFAQMHLDVVHGQTLDMIGNSSARAIATHKTASYTTIGPLTIGAALGGATDNEIERLGELALPLGIAFQFSDDLLGTFGITDITGKSTDNDLKVGKKTILLEEAQKRADDDQKSLIDRVLCNESATEEEISAAKSALIECGAKDACNTLIRDLVDTFRSGIEDEGFAAEGTDFLLDLARFIETRDK